MELFKTVKGHIPALNKTYPPITPPQPPPILRWLSIYQLATLIKTFLESYNLLKLCRQWSAAVQVKKITASCEQYRLRQLKNIIRLFNVRFILKTFRGLSLVNVKLTFIQKYKLTKTTFIEVYLLFKFLKGLQIFCLLF